MSDFEIRHQAEREPAGMKIVGIGVIASCLLLSALFGWGIYLNLTTPPCSCPVVESNESPK